MKIKKIESLCKKAKRIVLLDNKNEQWAGNGYALYALLGMPKLNEETVLKVFSMDDPDKYAAQYIKSIDGICLEDMVSDEIEATVNPIGISLGEIELLVLMSEIGVFFIQKRFLAPVADMPALNYTLRKGSNGYYVAIKSGMLLVGIIMPMRVDNDDIIQIRSIASCLTVTEMEDSK